MDRYYTPVSRDEDDSIDHQYKVYDYTTNEYQRTTKKMPSKMKTKYWMGKQQLRQKLGKEEDEWVVKGDSSLDAKLNYFHHVNHSCNALLRLCGSLQHHMKSLSHQELLLGKFLDARSKHESTEAGKMMSYIGYAEEYMSKKRHALFPSVSRLMNDLGVFQQKAVQDCSYTVDRMEQFRTEFRASLLWMDNISQELNPEDSEQLDKFRKVQSLTREKRVEFARMKDNTIQKIEILAASRVNLFSARLEEYHTATQKYFQSSINALKEVVAAKERLDVKIEEKRIADLEAEIDAHNPSKKSTKLISSASYTEKEDGEEKEEDQPPKLKDLKLSDDEDLLNLHDDFGDFETAAVDPAEGQNTLFDQTETLHDIFGRLSPVQSISESEQGLDLLGLGAGMERSGGFSGEVAGEEGNEPPQPEISNIPHIPEGVDWFCDLNNMNNNGEDNNEEGESSEALDWNMMSDLLTQPDNDLLCAPATEQDMLHLSEALSNLDTGLDDTVAEPDILTPIEVGQSSSTNTEVGQSSSTETQHAPKQTSGKMEPQQFNAWLNLFSELDPIAQNKSGNVA